MQRSLKWHILILNIIASINIDPSPLLKYAPNLKRLL